MNELDDNEGEEMVAAAVRPPAHAGALTRGDRDHASEPALVDAAAQAAKAPATTAFLIQLAETLGTTLDLRTLLARTAELIRQVLDFRIFAIFLLNERTHDLRMRYQVGHHSETERIRLKIGKGIVGKVAETRQALLVNDVSRSSDYIEVNPQVCSELAVPLIVKDRLLGVIDIESEQLNYFRPEHLHLLTLTASRIAQAIENARLYTRVARQAHTLRVLNEIAREFSAILDLPVLFARIGELLRRVVDFQFFTIWIIDETTGTLESRFSTRFDVQLEMPERLPVNDGLVGAAIDEVQLVHAPDVRKDPRYRVRNKETRSELVVPLIYKSTVIGVLDLEHTRSYYFNEDHERTLSTLASQIAISIENAQLYQRVQQQEQRLERDMNMAREVQLRLMPYAVPTHEHAEFAAHFLPARAIGGDLYDFLNYGSSSTAVAIGDVSGKAAPAALYAALVSGIMRSAGNMRPAPAEMLSLLNDSLQERHVASQYVTMVFAVWNDENMTLQIANAGATQPIFYRNAPEGGTVSIVRAEGFPLGLFPEVEYEEISVAAQPGDVLVFLSDGITDAEDATGEMYGVERVCALMLKNSDASASQLAALILTDIGQFQGETERFDDETVVVLRVR